MKTIHNTACAYGKSALLTMTMVTGTALMMAACADVKPVVRNFNQDAVVQAVRVPSGNVVVLETTAVGNLTYECRANAPAAGTLAWVLVSPSAKLYSRAGQEIGNYSGPPATWTLTDGSSVTGTQIAISPVVGAIHIPLQLSSGMPGAASGMLQNVTYIQRVNTKNGQDFIKPCTQAEVGEKTVRPYQADYIFWKAA